MKTCLMVTVLSSCGEFLGMLTPEQFREGWKVPKSISLPEAVALFNATHEEKASIEVAQ